MKCMEINEWNNWKKWKEWNEWNELHDWIEWIEGMNEMTEMQEMNETNDANKSNEMNEMNGMNEMTAMNEKLKWMKSKTMQDCHIETHVKISQEPLHTEIYMKNAQNADTHTLRGLRSRNACQDFIRDALYENLPVTCRRREWPPWSSTNLRIYRQNPSV